MEHIDLNFLFFDRDHPDVPFTNQQLYEIRRELSRTMEEAGFGEQIQNGPDKFSNTWAMPVDDTVFEGENHDNHLFIAFTWRAPLAHGNLTDLINTGIPRLSTFIHDNYHKNVLTRLAFV